MTGGLLNSTRHYQLCSEATHNKGGNRYDIAINSPQPTNSYDSLHCILFNARSLKNKLPDLHCLLRDKLDLIFVTETWLNDSVTDNILVNSHNYSVFRNDRLVDPNGDVCTGGGVCVFANNDTVRAVRVDLPQNFSHVEMCAIDIVNNVCSPIRLFVVYRAPSGNREPHAVNYTVELWNCIDSLYPLNGTVVLCGDFNIPSINWSVDNCIKCNDFSCSGLLLSLFYKHDFEQFVLTPTRNENILDLVFSNDHNSVFNVNVSEPFSTSDHCSVTFDVLFKVGTSNRMLKPRMYYCDFNNADWGSMRSFLFNFDFNQLFTDLSVSNICDCFYHLLHYCIDHFVPLKCIYLSSNSKGPCYPRHIKSLIHKKSAAWRSFRNKKTPSSRIHYNFTAAKCRREIRSFVRTPARN